jgi:predicted DNA binding CopG/RHH family protein
MAFHDEEERALIQDFERGAYRALPAKEEQALKAKLQTAAKAWLARERKLARINIRLHPSDLAALKAKALAEGLPYQTLAASLIHKYVSPPPAAAPPPPVVAKKRRTA